MAAELARDWWRDPNYSHGFLIPVVSGALLWSRRGELRAAFGRASWWGVVGALVAGSLLILGAAGSEVFTQRISLVLLLGSLALLAGGWRWFRLAAFPVAFLLLAVPLPYVIYYGLTGPLQGVAAECAVVGMRGVGILAVDEGNVIHLPGTSLEVAEACSGIRSLYAFLALGALFARSLPVPWWGKILVFALTVPLSVVGNAFRVWATGVGAHVIGPEVAQGTVHEFFGFVVFAGALLVLLLLGKGARRLWRSESS